MVNILRCTIDNTKNNEKLIEAINNMTNTIVNSINTNSTNDIIKRMNNINTKLNTINKTTSEIYKQSRKLNSIYTMIANVNKGIKGLDTNTKKLNSIYTMLTNINKGIKLLNDNIKGIYDINNKIKENSIKNNTNNIDNNAVKKNNEANDKIIELDNVDENKYNTPEINELVEANINSGNKYNNINESVSFFIKVFRYLDDIKMNLEKYGIGKKVVNDITNIQKLLIVLDGDFKNIYNLCKNINTDINKYIDKKEKSKIGDIKEVKEFKDEVNKLKDNFNDLFGYILGDIKNIFDKFFGKKDMKDGETKYLYSLKNIFGDIKSGFEIFFNSVKELNSNGIFNIFSNKGGLYSLDNIRKDIILSINTFYNNIKDSIVKKITEDDIYGKNTGSGTLIEQQRNAYTELINEIPSSFNAFFNEIKNLAENNIFGEFKKAYNKLVKEIPSSINAFFNEIKNPIVKKITESDTYRKIIESSTYRKIEKYTSKDYYSGKISELFEKIEKSGIYKRVGEYTDKFKDIYGSVKGVIGKAPGALKGIFGGLLGKGGMLGKIGGVIGKVGGMLGGVGGALGLAGGPIGIAVTGALAIGSKVMELVNKHGEKFSGYFKAYKKLFDVFMGLLVKPFADALGMLLIPVLKFLMMLMMPFIRNWNKALGMLKDMNIPMILRPFIAPIIANAFMIVDIVKVIAKTLFDSILNLPETLIRFVAWIYKMIVTTIAEFLRMIVLTITFIRVGIEVFGNLVISFIIDFFRRALILITTLIGGLVISIIRLGETILLLILSVISFLPEDIINTLIFITKQVIIAIDYIVAIVGSIANGIAGIFGKGDAFTGITNAMRSNLKGILDTLDGKNSKDKEGSNKSPKDIIKDIQKGINDYANSLVIGVIDNVGNITKTINDKFVPILDDLEKSRESALTGILDWTTESLASIEVWKDDSIKYISDMEENVVSIINNFRDSGLSIFKEYTLEAESIMGKVESAITEDVDKAVKDITEDSNKIKSIVNTSTEGFKQTISGMETTFKNTTSDIRKNSNTTLNSIEKSVDGGVSNIKATIDTWSVESLIKFDNFIMDALNIFSKLSINIPITRPIYSSVSSRYRTSDDDDDDESGGTSSPSGGTSSPSGGTSSPSGGTSSPSGGTSSPSGGTTVNDVERSFKENSDSPSYECAAHTDTPVLDGWIGNEVGGGHIDNYSDYSDMICHTDWDDYDDYSDHSDIIGSAVSTVKSWFGFHKGGEVPETGAYILHGGELVVPRWRVVDALVKMGDSNNIGGGANINIEMNVNIEGNVDDRNIDEIAEKIKEKLMDELRTRGVY